MQGNFKHHPRILLLFSILLAYCYSPASAADPAESPHFGEAICVPPHTFPSNIESEAWLKLSPALTPKDLETLLFDIAPAPTESDQTTQYIASLNALNAILYFGPNHPVLFLSQTVSAAAAGKETHTRLGNWLLFTNPTLKQPVIASLSARLDWEHQLARYFQANPERANSEVRLIWDWVLQNILTERAANQSEIIATGINAWYQSSDPHARLVPYDLLEQVVGEPAPPSFTKQLEKVGGQILSTPGGIKVGYLNLPSLNNLIGAIIARIKQMENAGAAGFVIDLRQNSGAFMEDTQLFLNIFLDSASSSKLLFYTTKPRENVPLRTFEAKTSAETRKALIILVDARTKSSGELIAGVLQSYKRAWIMGDVTFGKGSMLEPSHWLHDQTLLFESTKVLHYPNGGSPQLSGVEPDFLVNPDRSAPRELNSYTNPLTRELPHFIQTRNCEIQARTLCMNNLEKNLDSKSDFAKISPSDYVLGRSLLLMQCLTQEFSCKGLSSPLQ